MIWKDGGDCGKIYREVVNEDESHVIAKVRVRRSAFHRPAIKPPIPWPEGEANLHLILAAPQVLEALERMIEVYEAHFAPLPDGQQPKGAYTQARAAIAAAKGGEKE